MKIGVKNTLMASGAGFATPLLTFARPLSKVVTPNQGKTFRTGQHAPSSVVSFALFVFFVGKSRFLA